MRLRFPKLTFLLVMLSSVIASPQSTGSQLIDEFERLNSEEATARLQNAVGKLANRLEGHPEAMLQFILHRGENQPLGESYRVLGIQKAYLAAAKYDHKRLIFSVCEASPKAYTQIFLIDSVKEKGTCSPEEFESNAATLFVTTSAPNDKYELGTCCLIDRVGYSASMEVVKAFADLLNAHPEMTAYVVIYGGMNAYSYSVPPGPEKTMRRLDPPSFISKLTNDVRKRLTVSGIDKSRVVLITGGYRDMYASIDLWIIPPGSKKPKPTPDYFKGKRRRANLRGSR